MNIFQVFNNITVCVHAFPVIMSFCGCACLLVITGQKIDQAGGLETLLIFNFVWPYTKCYNSYSYLPSSLE